MAQNLDFLNNALNSYIVRPLNEFGLGGFVFDVEGETNVTLTADITDHYLEDNSAVQDHIAIRPKRVVLKGFVGELVFRDDDSVVTQVQRAVQKLTVLSEYLPVLTDGATQINNLAREDNETDVVFDGVNRIDDYWNVFRNIAPPPNAQERAYLYFKAMMENKILVSLQTPFEFARRMAIESVIARQEEGTRFVSDFTITLKEIRSVSVLSTEENVTQYLIDENTEEQTYQGRAFPQNQEVAQVGTVAGVEFDFGNVNDPIYQAALEAQRRRAEELGRPR